MSTSSSRPCVFLIDGNSQMYRAYHALRGLTAPDGRSTNAVYGFVNMLRKLLVDHRPTHIAAAFDVAGRTFRDDLYADYKANRAPMPDDLAEQVPWVHEACAALGVPVITEPGVEADDVIGTLALKAVAQGFDAVLVTGDKDFFQLVTDDVRVFNPRDEGTWYDTQGVHDKFGVRPDQVVDVLALMGDSVDNIKGVPGIGEKGAKDLIATYGSLEALLARADTVANKRYREGLQSHAAAARQSQELARIRTDLDVPFDPGKLEFKGPSAERCFALFSTLGFRSLLQEYAPTAAAVAKTYRVVSTSDELRALTSAIGASGRVAVAAIADHSTPMLATLVGLAFATGARDAWYVPLRRTMFDDTPVLPLDEVVGSLGPSLASSGLVKIGHDAKTITIVLGRYGLDIEGPWFDTMLASYVIDVTQSSHDLEPLALERLNYRALTEEAVRGKGVKALSLADVPATTLVDYAGERADLAWQLEPILTHDLKEGDRRRVYEELELPLVPILVAIERVGVRIDTQVLAAKREEVEHELERRTARIHQLAGESFNINSPKQLSEILFDKLSLPTTKKTGKTRTASTAVDVLEELALVHELPREILEWRGLMKIKGTYIDALPALINPTTGRVHTSFNQAVAATGRLSSSDPNLQNIPIRTELGREIRRAFVADPGWQLISADYSQIELRVLAHLAKDEALVEAFRRGDDIHDQTAAKVFGSESGLDPHELRRRAKIINYALLYGKTAFTLAKDIGVTPQAAQAFIDAYFAGFPAVRQYIDRTVADARQHGVVRTLFGRERRVPELTSRNGQIRAAAERVTVNLPIQGTAADIMKRAMIDVAAALGQAGLRTRMILTVHDELLLESPDDEVTRATTLVRDCMERAVVLDVPLTVDVGCGLNWKDAKS